MSLFDLAWALVKAELPDMDDPFARIISRPNHGLARGRPGDMDYTLRGDPTRALDALDDFYMETDYRTASPARTKGVESLIRELKRDRDEGNNIMFENPLLLAQRQIDRGRTMGGPTPYPEFASAVIGGYDAMGDEDNFIRDYLQEQERKDERATIGQALASPDGTVGQMFVQPGLTGMGAGQHLMGAILQDKGLVGDSLLSPEGYSLMNRLGNKLTAGGDLSILELSKVPELQFINEYLPNYYQGKELIDRIKGDFRFTRPTYGIAGKEMGETVFRNDPMESGEPGEFTFMAPNPHPYDMSRFTRTATDETSPLFGREFPLEIAYTGSDPQAVTNIERIRVPPREGGFFE